MAVVMDVENKFREWLKKQVYKDGKRVYTDNEITAYAYALRASCAQISQNLFLFSTPEDLDREIGWLKLNKDYIEIDKAGNGTLSTAIKLYSYFLTNGSMSTAPQLHSAFYLGGMNNMETVHRGKPMPGFHYHEVAMKPIQRVYYGAPGTGKSYTVRKLLEEVYPNDDDFKNHVKRVNFHPAYTYQDFIGTIKSRVVSDKPLDYMFVAGPFSELLKAAFLNPDEKYYLVIEEMNRGYAPAIFGDIFQLLDRGPDGKSEYIIVNRDIGSYFARDPWMKNIFHDGIIWLPANFNIIATMNTADENIFVMDTAFKRRFELIYIPIDFDILPDEMKEEKEMFKGTESLLEIFSDSEINGDFARKLAGEGKLNRNWGTFASLVNHAIDVENLYGKKQGKARNALIAENKKIGPFFIRPDEMEDPELFFNKIIFYLKQDVFYESTRLFTDSFEEIYNRYRIGGEDIFKLLA